ncbi:MAG: acetyl-CoA C-acyltransferase, partial [Staphylococcus simulans]|nr:acetyl-CoA C-acyltransferase [Staphylococcus simulans]
MSKIAIVSAKRTPVGKFRGKLRDYSAVQLGTIALEAAIDAINLPKDKIENVIFG